MIKLRQATNRSPQDNARNQMGVGIFLKGGICLLCLTIFYNRRLRNNTVSLNSTLRPTLLKRLIILVAYLENWAAEFD
jgi:hypothetical protein